ncbi:hypothetical protein FB451DRAFT_1516704 [Mycena latifolia]|nr:hypothetical protein FB451DRAFT_1516704 [Mycena latifolia]
MNERSTHPSDRTRNGSRPVGLGERVVRLRGKVAPGCGYLGQRLLILPTPCMSLGTRKKTFGYTFSHRIVKGALGSEGYFSGANKTNIRRWNRWNLKGARLDRLYEMSRSRKAFKHERIATAEASGFCKTDQRAECRTLLSGRKAARGWLSSRRTDVVEKKKQPDLSGQMMMASFSLVSYVSPSCGFFLPSPASTVLYLCPRIFSGSHESQGASKSSTPDLHNCTGILGRQKFNVFLIAFGFESTDVPDDLNATLDAQSWIPRRVYDLQVLNLRLSPLIQTLNSEICAALRSYSQLDSPDGVAIAHIVRAFRAGSASMFCHQRVPDAYLVPTPIQSCLTNLYALDSDGTVFGSSEKRQELCWDHLFDVRSLRPAICHDVIQYCRLRRQSRRDGVGSTFKMHTKSTTIVNCRYGAFRLAIPSNGQTVPQAASSVDGSPPRI